MSIVLFFANFQPRSILKNSACRCSLETIVFLKVQIGQKVQTEKNQFEGLRTCRNTCHCWVKKAHFILVYHANNNQTWRGASLYA